MHQNIEVEIIVNRKMCNLARLGKLMIFLNSVKLS